MYWHTNYVDKVQGLHPSQNIVLRYLCGKASPSGIWSTPYEIIAQESGISLRSAKSAVKALEEKGHIHVIRRRTGYDKSDVNKYIVFPESRTPPRQSRLQKPILRDRGAMVAPLDTKISLKLSRHAPRPPQEETVMEVEEDIEDIEDIREVTTPSLDEIRLTAAFGKDLADLVSFFHAIGTTRFDVGALLRKNNPKIKDPMILSLRDMSANEIATNARAIRRRAKAGSCIFIRPARHRSHATFLLDDVNVDYIQQILTAYRCAVVETSQANYQVWIAADSKLDEAERKAVQTFLSDLYGTDKGSLDGGHFGRMPGFENRKPSRGDFVARLDGIGLGKSFVSGDFLISKTGQQPATPARQAKPAKSSAATRSRPPRADGVDHSAKEFGCVVGALRAGVPEHHVRKNLLSHCADRRGSDAPRYVERTVTKAKEMLTRDHP